jgi:UDP-2,4-diacetamido-2,4,6-trideoxy-beta-L-altropyranose hydrolase
VEAVLAAFAPDMARAGGPEGFDAVVFDHYGLGEADHRRIAADRPALVIDDLADRPLGAELVLDVGLSRRAGDYAGLVRPGAELLIGPRYALVREDFAALRQAALARRGAGPVGRILVALGLTDVGGITGRVVRRLDGLDAAIDVVLGQAAPSLPQLRAADDPRLSLHVDTGEMARLTCEADLAIGAGGSSSWERCTLGLPTLMVVLAPNQQLAADALTEAGAALAVAADTPAFDAALARLLADGDLRAAQSRAAAALCDGAGAQRVAEAFVSHLTRRPS